MRFLKNTFNFTRSCAFPQKAKFYALKMLKNKISRIIKLPSWQHCERESDDDTIIDNYDDSSSDISMPSDVTVDSDSDSHSENDTDTNNNNRQPWPVPFQLEIGIPTISLVYLQDNQKYVHT